MEILTVLSVPILCTFGALLGVGECSQEPSSRTVGSVFARSVTAKDIGLTARIDTAVEFDARDNVRWGQMMRISRAFGVPVVERFVKEQKIEAMADEIRKFQNNSRRITERNVREAEAKLADLEENLAATGLSDDDRAKLTEQHTTWQKHLAMVREGLARDVSEDIARSCIVAWKTERELHRRFGGRVIFQQFGPEALDARRKLFEQAETEGNLRFDDVGVRHLFYYYFNMRHTFGDEKALERPWFLGDEK